MRWEGERQSDNVEDRRGLSIGGRGIRAGRDWDRRRHPDRALLRRGSERDTEPGGQLAAGCRTTTGGRTQPGGEQAGRVFRRGAGRYRGRLDPGVQGERQRLSHAQDGLVHGRGAVRLRLRPGRHGAFLLPERPEALPRPCPSSTICTPATALRAILPRPM